MTGIYNTIGKVVQFCVYMIPALVYNVIDYNYFITEQITMLIRELSTLCQIYAQSLGILI
jgi:hypothetical protein